MAEKKEEAPLLVTVEREFHVMDCRPVKAAKGANRIRVLLECEYTVESAEDLSPLFDKDVKVRLKELVSKKTRAKVGEEDSAHLFGEGDGNSAGPAE